MVKQYLCIAGLILSVFVSGCAGIGDSKDIKIGGNL